MPQSPQLVKAAVKTAIQLAYAAHNPPCPAASVTTFDENGQPRVTPGPLRPAALDDKLVDAIAEGVAQAIAPLLPTVPV